MSPPGGGSGGVRLSKVREHVHNHLRRTRVLNEIPGRVAEREAKEKEVVMAQLLSCTKSSDVTATYCSQMYPNGQQHASQRLCLRLQRWLAWPLRQTL